MSRKRPKRPCEALSRTIVVPNDIQGALQPAADARGITVNKLCRELLGTIADENLIDAIMDDLTEVKAA